jgi:hypothetical protein
MTVLASIWKRPTRMLATTLGIFYRASHTSRSYIFHRDTIWEIVRPDS